VAEDEVKLDEVNEEAQTTFHLPIKPPMTVVSSLIEFFYEKIYLV
jgi:hypothetical protein